MYQTTGGCGRVVKRRLTDGTYSYGFTISRNLRKLGKATHITLAPILTIRQADFAAKANEFWKIVDEKIAELTKAGILWVNDSSKIESKFAEYIPRPISAPKTPAIAPKSDYETYRDLVRQVAEKAEKRLNAEL